MHLCNTKTLPKFFILDSYYNTELSNPIDSSIVCYSYNTQCLQLSNIFAVYMKLQIIFIGLVSLDECD